jgi:hypothetical protein
MSTDRRDPNSLARSETAAIDVRHHGYLSSINSHYWLRLNPKNDRNGINNYIEREEDSQGKILPLMSPWEPTLLPKTARTI